MSSYDAPYTLQRSLTEGVARFEALARERKADADAVTALVTAAHTEGGSAPRTDVALGIAARAGILA